MGEEDCDRVFGREGPLQEVDFGAGTFFGKGQDEVGVLLCGRLERFIYV